MPLPRGFKDRRVFASDDTFAAGPNSWNGLDNKAPAVGYAQGLLPGEEPTAQEVNHELHAASLLRFLVDIEALNFVRAENALFSGLSDFRGFAFVYQPADRIWMGLASVSDKLFVTSYNGDHWIDDTANVPDYPAFPCNLFASGTNAWIVGTGGEIARRATDGSTAGAWGSVVDIGAVSFASVYDTGSGQHNPQSWIVEENNAVLAGAFRTPGNTPCIVRLITGGFTIVPDSETSGLAAYDVDAVGDGAVSFVARDDERLVCFVASTVGNVQTNVFRWSNDAPSFTTDWVGSATNTIASAATFGRVIGLAVDDLGTWLALTSSGRVYASLDAQTWVRRDQIVSDVSRTFRSCQQVGEILYSIGTLEMPSELAYEAIFCSTDYGVTWRSVPSPLSPTLLPNVRRIRAGGDRLMVHGTNNADDFSAPSFSLRTS